MLDHADHVALLRGGVPEREADAPPPVWADLGSGGGAFTLALVDLLGADGPGATIFSVDANSRVLARQQGTMATRFPAATVRYHTGDFTRPLGLPPLDGAVMANSLHFVRDTAKGPTLRLVRDALRPGGRLLLVEYDADRGNPWVPHPMTYGTWERVAAAAGFRNTRLLHRVPSRFLGAIYAALSFAPERDAAV